MANINLAGYNLNPGVFKFNWGASTAPAAAPQENPFSGTLRKYSDAYERRMKDIMSKMGKDDLGIGAAIALSQAGPSPEQLEQQAALRYQEAQLAQKMSQENLELLSKKSKEKQARDFTYSRLGDLLSAIPRSFNPIPYEKTQELAANIANISNPGNLSRQADLQAASYSLPRYFT